MAQPLFLLRLLIRSGLARYFPGSNRLGEGGADYLHYCADPLLTASRSDRRCSARWRETPPSNVIDLSTAQPRSDVAVSLPRLSTDHRACPAPWGLPELRAAVAERLHDVSPDEEVIVTQGATGALRTVLDAFVNRGDRVVLFDPSSPLFGLALKSHGARVRWLYSWNEEGRLRFKLPDLDRALRGARLMILSTPSNPLGASLSADDVEQLLWWAEKRDVLLIDDQTFADFCYEADNVNLSSLPHARKRTLTIGSVSNSHGLTALRVGWLAGNRPLMRACQLSASARMTLVPTVCQQMALAALQQSPDALATLCRELAARRHHVRERLVHLGLRPSWPAGGWFVWLPVWELDRSGRAFAEQLLQEKRVQVTPGDQFGPGGIGYVRLCFAGDEGRLREGMSRLADFVQGVVPAALPIRKAA